MNTRLSSILPILVLTALPVVGILLPAASVDACSIPVFRYALQFWEPDRFEALVFHQGELGEADEKAVKQLIATANADVGANVNIQRVDLADEELPAALRELWKRQESSVLPHVLTLYPESYGPAVPAESISLAEFRFDNWTTSPARKTITERLAKGESAVWVLLEIGDEKKDAQAMKKLETTLAELEKTLELPEQVPEPDLLFEPDVEVQAELRVAFSTLAVSRSDPAEKHFVNHLLHSEEDLFDFQEPMVFAVFGRGRSLPALVGAGINEDVISEVASFLTGPCSCQVKAQNPGFDLLIAADWETLLQKANAALSEETTALAQTEGSSDGRPGEPADGPPAFRGDRPTDDASAVTPVERPTAPSSASITAPESGEVLDPPPSRGPMLLSVLLVVGLGLAALVVGTAIIVKKNAATS